MKNNIKNLLYKEVFLATHPAFYLFTLLSAMILIPSYPAIVSIGYICLALFNIASFRKANRDVEFTAALPVKRDNVVTGYAMFVVVFEAVFLFIAAICAAVADFVISPFGNVAGMDPNLAFFGVTFVCLGIFNYVFLTGFYKTGYKAGLPTLLGVIAFIVVYGVCEAVVQCVPAVRTVIDTLNPASLWIRGIVLAVGVCAYAVLTFAAVKISQKRFDKVSL